VLRLDHDADPLGSDGALDGRRDLAGQTLLHLQPPASQQENEHEWFHEWFGCVR
jgi:hypothetical protein